MKIKINPRSWLDVVTAACLVPPITIGVLGLVALAIVLCVVALPFVTIGFIFYSIFS